MNKARVLQTDDKHESESAKGIQTDARSGVWLRSDVKVKMTDLVEQKALCLPNCSFSGKSDDFGSTYEFKYYSAVDRRTVVYRGHVKWTWQGSGVPGTLSPGEKITITGVVSNLTAESGGVTAYATFGHWGFMKPETGKPLRATANSSTTMIGTFEVPSQPLRNNDGTLNPFLYLTFLLSGGNEQQFVERTITYKWTTVTTPGDPTITRIDWTTQADRWRGQNGRRFTVACPPGAITSRLWGTGVYTDDSSICTAAVHAGLIEMRKGGTVTIEIQPGASSYQGSTVRGVTSKGYGAWRGSFVFVTR